MTLLGEWPLTYRVRIILIQERSSVSTVITFISRLIWGPGIGLSLESWRFTLSGCPGIREWGKQLLIRTHTISKYTWSLIDHDFPRYRYLKVNSVTFRLSKTELYVAELLWKQIYEFYCLKKLSQLSRLKMYPLCLCSCFCQLQILKCSHNYITELPYEVCPFGHLILKWI